MGRFQVERQLKQDLFGRIEQGRYEQADGTTRPAVRRDWTAAPPWTRPLARWLAGRERRALDGLPLDPALPRLLDAGRGNLVRTWIEGRALHEVGTDDPAWYGEARRLLTRLHRHGVTHNDLAKEPNWVVTPGGGAALIDFQLARVSPARGRLFRMLGREDLRHLLKHKRTYCAAHLTPRERSLLASPSLPARLIRRLVKPPYTLVTRGLLGWQDREGQGPRP